MALDIVDAACIKVEAESENSVLDLLEIIAGFRYLIRHSPPEKRYDDSRFGAISLNIGAVVAITDFYGEDNFMVTDKSDGRGIELGVEGALFFGEAVAAVLYRAKKLVEGCFVLDLLGFNLEEIFAIGVCASATLGIFPLAVELVVNISSRVFSAGS